MAANKEVRSTLFARKECKMMLKEKAVTKIKAKTCPQKYIIHGNYV